MCTCLVLVLQAQAAKRAEEQQELALQAATPQDEEIGAEPSADDMTVLTFPKSGAYSNGHMCPCVGTQPWPSFVPQLNRLTNFPHLPQPLTMQATQ